MSGKQFIRWGKSDIVVPTDRFSPRDYLTVIDAPFLAVTGLRGTAQFAELHGRGCVGAAAHAQPDASVDATMGRSKPPNVAAAVPIVEAPTAFPRGAQTGVRFGQIADRLEYSASFYDGFNHLPDFHVSGPEAASRRPRDRTCVPAHSELRRRCGRSAAVVHDQGGELPTSRRHRRRRTNMCLYVLQLERQRGEWVFLGGYTGEVATRERSPLSFAPDRGLSRSIVARASCTIDANRRVEFESAVRQNGDGVYAKAEYLTGARAALARHRHRRGPGRASATTSSASIAATRTSA